MEKFRKSFRGGPVAATENQTRTQTFVKRVAVVSSVAVALGFAQVPSAQAAAAPAKISLGATVVATPATPFVDGNSGTSVSVTIDNLVGVTDQDVLYLGLTNNGTVTRRLIVTPSAANGDGNVTSARTAFTTTVIGSQGYRLWVDQPDGAGVRNRAWDNTVALNEPVTEGAFQFAGNPSLVNIFDAQGVVLGASVSVIEGTCQVFQATVTDKNSVGIRNQQLALSFEAGVPGSAPEACTAADLDASSQDAVTTLSGGKILTGRTNDQGKVRFAIKGGKGAPAWSGDVTARVVDPLADSSAFLTFSLSTNPGGSNAASKIAAEAPATAPRLSAVGVNLTLTDRYGKALQGVVLTANPSASAATATALDATDMNGRTSYRVDTSVLGTQHILFWANKTGRGVTSNLDAGEASVTVDIQIVPQTADITKSSFTADQAVVPTDAVNNSLLLTVNDSSGSPVRDVQIDFTVPTPTPNQIVLSALSGVTDTKGQISIRASRLASITSRQTITVTGTIRNSNPVVTISVTFEIQPRAASQIALNSISQMTTTDRGTARIDVALRDQFGAPFAGVVGFRSTSGRNKSDDYANNVTTNADGHAVANFADVAGPSAFDFDTVVAEARTVDDVLISSSPVIVHYTPSLSANHVLQSGLPSSYNVLYGDAYAQSVLSVVAQLQNRVGNLDSNLYSVPAQVTVSGPANFIPSGTSLDLVSDNAAKVTFAIQPTGVAGTITVTLTSGGTATAWTTKVVPNADGARNISLVGSAVSAKSGATTRFTATATDVFGNVLPSVRMTFVSSGVGLLNSSMIDQCGGIGTSESAYSVPAFTNATGQAWTDLRTTAYDAGTARVTAYLGNPFNNGCISSYPEATKSQGSPFSGAAAGNTSVSATAIYGADTTMADMLASILAEKAAAQALATQAATDKAAAIAAATQAAAAQVAAQAAAQALATQAASDRAAAQAAASQAAASQAAAQALATQTAADRAAANALATQAATDKAAAIAAADKSTADKVAAQAAADKASGDKSAAQIAASQAAADRAAAQALASQAAADKVAAEAAAAKAATDKASAEALTAQATTQIASAKATLVKANSIMAQAKLKLAKAMSLIKAKKTLR